MSDDLPEGWALARLAEITESVPNAKPEEGPQREFGYVDISSVNNRTGAIETVKRFKGKDAPSRARRPIRPNDILFSNVRTNLKNVAIVPDGLDADLCSTGFTVLRPNTAVIPRYLLRCVLTDAFIDRVTSQQTGTHYPATSDRVVMSQTIPLPPLSEQRRIVAMLDQLLARVEACQERLAKASALLKRFRQSVLSAACSGRLTADWREQNPNVEPVRGLLQEMKQSAQGIRVRRGVPDHVPQSDAVASWELPDTWGSYSAAELLQCGAFVDVKDGNHGANHPKVSDFTEAGVPFITAAQVKDFRIDYDGAYKLSGKPLGKIRVGLAKSGDVIYTHKGSVGRVAIADRNCVLTPQTTYYRVSPKVLVNRFTMFYLASHPFSAQADVVKEQTTRDFVPISEQYLLFHRVPPLHEQHEIVRRVEQMFGLADQAEARISKALQLVSTLSPSLLARAFCGDLVHTEAELARTEGRNYEPASVVLERARHGREIHAVPNSPELATRRTRGTPRRAD